MIQLITILISLAAIVISFFSPLWGWGLIALPTAYLFLNIWALKQSRYKYVNELSPEANMMLQKFGHFYNMPLASRDHSSTASTLMFVAAILAIVGLFQRFWWGLALGFVYWPAMGFVARAYNPTNYLADDVERRAHAEIIDWIRAKQRL